MKKMKNSSISRTITKNSKKNFYDRKTLFFPSHMSSTSRFQTLDAPVVNVSKKRQEGHPLL